MNLIFDWSGTLADDQCFTWEITNDTLEHFGAKRVSFDEYQRDFVIPVSGFYEPRCPGVSIEEIDQFFFARYEQRAGGIELFPGVASMLKELRGRHRAFILTTNATRAVERCLTALQLDGLFEEICGHAFDKRQHLPALLDRRGLRTADTAFFGDTPHDVETGNAAGVVSVGVSFGYGSAQALNAASPSVLLQQPADLRRYIVAQERKRRPAATVGGLVFNSAGEALFIRTEKWSGLWGTPGGHIELGETMADAFRREVLEETGLSIETPQLVLTAEAVLHPEFIEPRHFILLSFTANAAQAGPVTLNEEASEYRWASLDRALELQLNEPTRQLVELVMSQRSGR